MNDWVLGSISIAGALTVALGISLVGSDQGVYVGAAPLFFLCGVFA